MGLLIEMSQAQKDARFKSEVVGQINQGIGMIQSMFSQLMAKMWLNPERTPQEAFAAMGGDAVALFQLAAATQTFLNTIKPNSAIQQVPPSVNIVFNQDGTVTITAKQ